MQHAISRSAEALMGIINDLLIFSKIEAGRLTLEEVDFDLDVLLKDVLALYQPRADAKDWRCSGYSRKHADLVPATPSPAPDPAQPAG